MTKIVYRNMLFILLSLFFITTVCYAQQSLYTQVDRTTLAEDETLRLTLSINGYVDNDDIDLHPLEQNFEILGTAKSKQLSIINGVNSTQTKWLVSLAPKHTGELEIPILRIGNLQSNPIKITVTAAQTTNTADNQAYRPIFLEAEIIPNQSYIQSQAIYILRLFYAVDIQSGALTDPSAENILISQLGNDNSYEATRYGRRYAIVERRYAIFPQKSGPISINPPIFRGTILDYQTSKGLNIFLPSNSRQVRLAAPTLTLHVKPKPEGITNWLPAQQLTATANWSSNLSSIHAGEPITRIITLEGTGISAAQLPALPQPTVHNLKRYVDKPQLNTITNGSTIIGKRTEKIAYIASQPGNYKIPAIQVSWWNTQTQRAAIVTIPEEAITILPAATTDTSGSLTTQTNSAATIEPVASDNQTKSVGKRFSTTVLIILAAALVFLLLWIITLWAWWRQKHQIPKTFQTTFEIKINKPTSIAMLRQTIEQACCLNNAQQAKDALLAWGNAIWTEAKFLNLGELAEQFTSPEAKTAIHDLDKCIYASSSKPWNGSMFWSQIAKHLEKSSPTIKSPARSTLPPLYLQN